MREPCVCRSQDHPTGEWHCELHGTMPEPHEVGASARRHVLNLQGPLSITEIP